MSFLFYQRLKILNVFAAFVCQDFVFSYLFVFHGDFIVGTVLLLLVLEHLFHVSVFFPSLKSALFLLFIKVAKNTTPVFLSHFVMMRESTEAMIVLSKRS